MQVPRLRRFRGAHRISELAASFVSLFDERGVWQLERSGELLVLDRLAGTSPRLVFDVGAHEGAWSTAVASRIEDAVVHAFEPIAANASVLRATVESGPGRIHVHQLALGSTNERRQISLDARHSTTFSLLDDPTAAAAAEFIVVRRGDLMMTELAVDRIDLLKIDTEGFDHEVLQGFGDALDPARIPVIQFEYGPWAAQTKFLLKDFHQLLEDRGYTVGRLRRRGVTFGAYRRSHENFTGLNYIAVDRDRQDLLELLSESRHG